MNCSRCGSEVSESADFCARCGTPLAGYAHQADEPSGAAPGGPGPVQGGMPGPVAAPGPGGRPAYNFDAARWSLADRIAGIATLITMIALFLPWFDASASDNLGDTFSASASGTTAHGWLWFVFVIGLITLLYLGATAGFQRLPFSLPVKHERLLLAATGIDLLLVFIAFVLKPTNGGLAGVSIGWDFGAFIALIAAIAAVVQPVRSLLADRNAAAGR